MPTITNLLRPTRGAWIRVPAALAAAVGCATCRDTAVAPPPPPNRVVAVAVVPPTAGLSPESRSTSSRTASPLRVTPYGCNGPVAGDGRYDHAGRCLHRRLNPWHVQRHRDAPGRDAGKARIEVFRRWSRKSRSLPTRPPCRFREGGRSAPRCSIVSGIPSRSIKSPGPVAIPASPSWTRRSGDRRGAGDRDDQRRCAGKDGHRGHRPSYRPASGPGPMSPGDSR